MVLTLQKPTQRTRIGERPEGLSGSTKSVVCVERSVKNLGDPDGSCCRQVGDAERGADGRQGVRSAHSTRSRESRAHGEGADRKTEPVQETLPEREGSDPQCQPPCRE